MVIDMFKPEDEGKYSDEYVAMVSFTDKKVIAHGKDIEKVFNKAKEITSAPVVIYVHAPNKSFVFWDG